MIIDIIIQIALVLILLAYLFANVMVAATHTTEFMKEEFITNQRLIGKICANAFYSLAWLLKGINKIAHKIVDIIV